MLPVTLYEVLAECFAREQVSVCFALLGDANMHWAAALAARQCKFVYTRHEHCAVSAAMAWSRINHEVGVASVTCGPGVTQIMTALPAAVRARIPLVIFAGEAPLAKDWYNQQIEQRPLIEACGAHYVALHDVQAMPQGVRNAFLYARQNQTPVVIGVPMDLQKLPWPSAGARQLPPASADILVKYVPREPELQALLQAAALVNQAEKVVVMAGLGAVRADAGAACSALANKCDGLLATTLPARGLFYQDEFDLGVVGGFSSTLARQCLQQADLVIAVGASLASHNADAGQLFKPKNVLQIDLNPVSVSQGRVSALHHLQADASVGAKALAAVVNRRQRDSGFRSAKMAHRIATEPADDAEFQIEPGLHDPRHVVAALDKYLPLHWQLVNSSGHCSWFSAQMRKRPASHFVTIREFGAIGNGISYAIGAAMARPHVPTVLLDGDGSLLMHIQELETIVRHQLNLLICVLNDGGYGSEVHKLRADGMPLDGASFGHTDFANIANGFSLAGVQVDALDSLEALVASYAEQGGAAVWDFPISDQVVSPVIRRTQPL